MRILALETTEAVGSLAALDDERLLAYLKLDPRRRSAQMLAPGIVSLLTKAGWRPQDIELIAVTVGPGSFTGLRVGLTTAKTLAYAAGAAVIGVNTLQVVAERAPAGVSSLHVVMDAQRSELFAGSFRRGQDGHFQPERPVRVVGEDQWLADLQPGDTLSGPALRRLASRVSLSPPLPLSPSPHRAAPPDPQLRLPAGITLLDPALWPPDAAATGQLAFREFRKRGPDDLFQLVPRYYRKSAAEEKAERDEGSVRDGC